MKIVPPQVIAAVVGLILGWFLGLRRGSPDPYPREPVQARHRDAEFLRAVHQPLAVVGALHDGPDPDLIDGVESLATIAAIDKIDPFRRKSDPNKTLNAMGVSNLCSSLAGGLTIIPGGVKSTTAILCGARTQWANFYNACFLILYLLLGRNLINLMPMSVLGAIVLYTGYKLCAPKVWKHVAHIGSEQLFVFTTTVLCHGHHRPALGHRRRHRGQAGPGSRHRGEGRARTRRRPRAGRSRGEAVARRDRRAVPQPRREERDGRRHLPPVLRTADGLLQLHASRTELSLIPRWHRCGLPAHHRPGDA